MATLGDFRGVETRVSTFFKEIAKGDFEETPKAKEWISRSGVSSFYATKRLQELVVLFVDPEQRREFSRQVALIEEAIRSQAGIASKKKISLPEKTKLNSVANELYKHLLSWVEKNFFPFAYQITHG